MEKAVKAYRGVLRLVKKLPEESRPYYPRENFVNYRDMSIISRNEENPNGRTEQEVKQMFEEWIAMHSKSYTDFTEKDKRFKIFEDNLLYIDRHNAGNHSYQCGLNKFSDLTNDEFRSTYLMEKSFQTIGMKAQERTPAKQLEACDARRRQQSGGSITSA